MPMQTNRSFKFTPAAKQVPENAFKFRELRIHAHNFNEGVNRLVGFTVQKKGKPFRGDLRHLLGFAPLLLIEPPAPPTGKEEDGYEYQIPKVKFHD